jgi:hypothetical protein
LLAGLFALVFAEPSVDAAIALEEAGDVARHAHDDGISRDVQRIGLVVGTGLYGMALGAMFGVAAMWARGRLRGDAWTRAWKLGAAAIAAFVLLPALKYPANPPAAGDPATVGGRTGWFVVLWAGGLLLAVVAWAGARALTARSWSRPAAHATVGAAVVATAAVLLAALPGAPGAGDVPADLLWSFRLWSVATQVLLFGGTAACYGLLSARAEHARSAAPAR